ncbi:MAG: outer membrane beta-barrel protein [Acidobacteriota bacterium]
MSIVFVLVPVLGFAQQYHVEIVPTAGFRWGGDIRIEERAFKFQNFNTSISSGGSYGLRLDIPLGTAVALELLADQQRTSFQDDQGLFGEVPGGFIKAGDSHALDIDVAYYHAGLLFDLAQGPTRGYLVATAGITQINPQLPLPNDTRFSAGVGAGIKLDLTDRLGFRFEGRYYWTKTDAGKGATYSFANPDCQAPCSYTFKYRDSLDQFAATVGLAIRF